MTASLQTFYKAVGTSKQGFHGYLDRDLVRKDHGQQVLKLIAGIRKDHPDMGLREMYYLIQPEWMGRDAFEALGKEHGLCVRIYKNFHRTTDSSGTKFFPNLIEKLEIVRPNQVWQSDITYYEINGKFNYITLIQDTFSKIIVGHSASDSLATEQTTLPSLNMALGKRRKQGLRGLIFHSDGGGQYYCKEFIILITKHQIESSMGKSCYENAMAECLNGVIKNKYLRYREIKNLAELNLELDRAVALYNSSKPHSALGRMTPELFEKNYLP